MTEHDDDLPGEPDDCVSVAAFIEMTARLLGRIHALEVALAAIISRREDVDALERHADAILLHDEASRIDANGTEEETIQTHEWGRQATTALFANARTARKLR